MTLSLTFHGAARTVTGSCAEFRSGKSRIPGDCGLFQGSSSLEALNHEPLAFDPKKIDTVLLTHAHINYGGLLPRLTAEGFAGPTWCIHESSDLNEYADLAVSMKRKLAGIRDARARQKTIDEMRRLLDTHSDHRQARKQRSHR